MYALPSVLAIRFDAARATSEQSLANPAHGEDISPDCVSFP